jgi:hypothetical protein
MISSAVKGMSPDRSTDPARPNADPLLREIVRLNSVMMGIVSGLLAGLVIFIATLLLVMKGGPNVGQHLSLLAQFFPGYRVTFLGSFVGLGYGFVSGFLIGCIIGRLYNYIVRLSER